MSYTQISEERSVNVLLHKTHPTYTKNVEIPAGLTLDETRQQAHIHAACHLRADALPDASEIIIAHSHPVNTSIGVFAQGADVHAVVPAMTDLLPRPVTCDEGLDHSEYKAVLTALMNLNLDTLLMNHRKQTAELVAGLETSINDLRVQLEEETKVRAQELDAIWQHVKEVETLFGLQ